MLVHRRRKRASRVAERREDRHVGEPPFLAAVELVAPPRRQRRRVVRAGGGDRDGRKCGWIAEPAVVALPPEHAVPWQITPRPLLAHEGPHGPQGLPDDTHPI